MIRPRSRARSSESGATSFDCGGLRFEATFRAPQGATLRVFADVAGQRTELLRFDDFVDGPHYHVPGAGPAIAFDRDEKGEPLAWIVAELRDDLGPLITTAGYAEILPEPRCAGGHGQRRPHQAGHGGLRTRGLRPGSRRRPAADRRLRSDGSVKGR